VYGQEQPDVVTPCTVAKKLGPSWEAVVIEVGLCSDATVVL
jgi:hypothetical protein